MTHLMIFAMLVLSFLSAHAGNEAGNGGVSIVCRDQSGEIISAEILDIYEGREVYGRTYSYENLSFQTKIQLAQLKLTSYPGFLKRLQDKLTSAQANTVFIPYGSELEATNDALPLIKKKGCKFEQLANYTRNGELLISQEIYSKLDNTNKAALYVHEAAYTLRRNSGDTDSQKSRRLVAHLMAENGDQKIIASIIGQSVPQLPPKPDSAYVTQDHYLEASNCKFESWVGTGSRVSILDPRLVSVGHYSDTAVLVRIDYNPLEGTILGARSGCVGYLLNEYVHRR
jgi:hypothetical protein